MTQQDSARSGLVPYRANSGFKDVGGRVKLGYTRDGWGPWSVVATFAYFRLINSAADSPVVARAGDENQIFCGLALMYRK